MIIRFIRDYTAEPIGIALQEQAQEFGLAVSTEFGAYENLGAEIAGIASVPEPPATVIVTSDLEYFSGGIFSPRWNFSQVRVDFEAILKAIDTLPPATFALISTFIPPFRASLPWAPDHPVLGKDSAAFQLNALLREFVAQRPNRCGLLDFERIAARLGEGATVDRRFGLMNKAPFKPEFVTAAAAEVLRYLRCRFLPPKKVLVLDCDNTLWGGVLGEAGPDKIELDPYEYPGVAYYRFQSEILSIAEKGILICLNSKNDEAAVWEVLDKHPHCLLRRDRIAAHRINWSDKATNIKELALELNLGLDSMVFVDDSPAECELVRSQFPEVTVIQTPSKVYDLPGILKASPFFDRLSVSKEDKERVQYYQADQGRRDLQERHVDAQSFLKDLHMKACIRPIQNGEISRAAQLCQRTNQFNLTSKRYSESDLSAFLDRPDVRMFLLQAEDRFGPMGVSGLIIWKKSDGVAEVDTFLMSCRIIGRLLDRALFYESLRMLKASWPVNELRGSFVPSKKNSIVSKLWDEYGFAKVSSADDETYACRVTDLKVAFPDIVELQESL